MRFWNKDRPKAALRVEQNSYSVESKPTHVVGTVDEITKLIAHMRSDPNYFINKIIKEQYLSHFDQEGMSLSIKNTENTVISNKGEDIPVLATARYVYTYKQPSGFLATLAALPFLLIPMLIVFAVCYVLALSVQRAEDGSVLPPECILYIEDGKPIAVDVRRTMLYYDPAEDHASLLDYIWEGTAMPDQLRMAYHPVEAGCEMVHIVNGKVVEQ